MFNICTLKSYLPITPTKSRKAGNKTPTSSASRTLRSCMKVSSMRSLLPCHFSSVGLTFFTMCLRQ